MYIHTLGSLLELPLLSSLIISVLANPTVQPISKENLPLPVSVVHEFQLGTWIENLAVRATGQILATSLTSSDLFQVDPTSIHPTTVVCTFPANASTGIVEFDDDIFYVIAGNFTLATLTGSWAVYEVDLRHYSAKHGTAAKVSKITDFPGAVLLNGIAALSRKKHWLLIGDSGAGVVYRLNVRTGETVKVIEDPLTKSPNRPGVGINGIKVRNHTLFFANTDRKIFGRIPVSSDGTPEAPPTVVANLEAPDDFSLGARGQAFVALNGANALVRVSKEGAVTRLAGGAPGSVLAGPTATALGRGEGDRRSVYISTSGGVQEYVTGNVTVAGTISRVDLKGYY